MPLRGQRAVPYRRRLWHICAQGILHRSCALIAHANPFGTMIQMAKSRWSGKPHRDLSCSSRHHEFAVWSYYGVLQFGWGPLTIGATVLLSGILLRSFRLLVGKVIARFGAVPTAVYSLMFAMPIMFSSAFQISAKSCLGWWWGRLRVHIPRDADLDDAQIAEDSQGELQGAIASMVSVTAILGRLR